ncbi:MAG: hypothetical protein AAFY76_01020 [Cyanobacteria bacterium J06649_11]
MRITFLSQNTKLKNVLYYHTEENGLALYWTKEEFEKWENGESSKNINLYREDIRTSMKFYESIVRYEYEMYTENYSILGLADRANHYRKDVAKAIFDRIKYYIALQIKLSDDIKPYEFPKLLNHPNYLIDYLSDQSLFRVTEPIQTLCELYVLMKLNELTSRRIDVDFGNTLFDFIVQDGIKQFNEFVDQYFSNEDIHNIDAFDEHRRNAKILKSLFPPRREQSLIYKDLLVQHLDLFDNE